MGVLSRWMKHGLTSSENTIFLVLGVTKVGDFRDYKVLESFSFSPSHVRNNSPLLVNPADALNYDYVLVVEESVAKRNRWLK